MSLFCLYVNYFLTVVEVLHDEKEARTDAETGEMAVSHEDDIPASQQSKLEESKEAEKGKNCNFA